MFKSWGDRHLRQKFPENLQNLLEYYAELLITFPECFTIYSEKFFKLTRTLFRKYQYPRFLNSSINFTELFFRVILFIIIFYEYLYKNFKFETCLQNIFNFEVYINLIAL